MSNRWATRRAPAKRTEQSVQGRRKSQGFTLIELLIVIAIVALLVMILAPSLRLARVLTLETLCANNIHELGKAEICYAVEAEAFSPWGRTIGYGASYYNEPWGIEQSLLYPYLGESKEVFLCPIFTGLTTETAYFSYSMNWNLGIYSGEAGEFESEEVQSLQRVRNPAEMAIFCEENPWANSPYATHSLNDGQMVAEIWPERDSFGTFHRPRKDRYANGRPHPYVGTDDDDLNTGVTHAVFMDGHVEWVTALQTERFTRNNPDNIRYIQADD